MNTNLAATKNKKGVLWIKSFSVFCLALAFIAVGCQQKKNKSNPLPPPPPTQPPSNYYGGNYGGALCPTCNMNVAWTIFAGSDSQSSSGAVSLSLDFYGDPNLGYYFYDPRIPMMYSGPVIVRGQMTINRVDSLICSVPVGQYQIISISAGNWMGGVVTSGYSGYGPTALTMQAQNLQYGNIVILRLAKAVIYNPNGTNSWYPNKLGGTLMFDSNNGMPCYSYSGPTYTEIF